jgi:hypothetical protein
VHHRIAIATLVVLSSTTGCEWLAGLDARHVGSSGGGGGQGSTVTSSTDATSTSSPSSSSTGAGCGISCDPQNCGLIGHDCLGGACVDGVCKPFVVADGQSHPEGLALDDAFVYFTELDDNGIRRCPLAGCGPTLPGTVISGDQGVHSIAIDSTGIYFTEYTNQASFWKCPPGAGGCSPTQLLTPGTMNDPTAFALDADDAYFALLFDGIQKCSKSGCPSTTPVSQSAPTTGLTLDGSLLYWKSGSSVKRCHKNDCAATTELVTTPAFTVDSGQLHVRGNTLFLTSSMGLFRCDTTSVPAFPCVPKRISSFASLVRAFAVDPSPSPQFVYFSEGILTPARVFRAAPNATDTTDPDVLIDGQNDPLSFAINDQAVYWVNNGLMNPTGEVMGLAK